MQLTVEHDLNEPLVLPINYLHILQSVIYASIGEDKEYAEKLHDLQNESARRSFKFFQFSTFQGKYEVENKQIIFRKHISFEVRSASSDFIQRVKSGIEKNGVTYQERHFDNVTVSVKNKVVAENDIVIRMKTPICVYQTERYSSKTYFPDVQDKQFFQLINDNFKRKYKAFTGTEPEGDIRLECIQVGKKDHVVTNYKGFYISGWKGLYRLQGEKEYIDFLYQVGLGSKNSQGFGMFDIV